MWHSRAIATRCGAIGALLALTVAPASAPAKVFLSRAEALTWAFPDAYAVESETHILTDAQVARVKSLSGAQLDSKLVTVYTGRRGDAVLGHAFLQMHTVRTQSEAFLVVISPEGRVERLRMLAFHEPLEYLPPERWLDQFEGVGDDAPLRVSRDIHGLAGSTLSANAVTRGVRGALALYRVLVRGEE